MADETVLKILLEEAPPKTAPDAPSSAPPQVRQEPPPSVQDQPRPSVQDQPRPVARPSGAPNAVRSIRPLAKFAPPPPVQPPPAIASEASQADPARETSKETTARPIVAPARETSKEPPPRPIASPGRASEPPPRAVVAPARESAEQNRPSPFDKGFRIANPSESQRQLAAQLVRSKPETADQIIAALRSAGRGERPHTAQSKREPPAPPRPPAASPSTFRINEARVIIQRAVPVRVAHAESVHLPRQVANPRQPAVTAPAASRSAAPATTTAQPAPTSTADREAQRERLRHPAAPQPARARPATTEAGQNGRRGRPVARPRSMPVRTPQQRHAAQQRRRAARPGRRAQAVRRLQRRQVRHAGRHVAQAAQQHGNRLVSNAATAATTRVTGSATAGMVAGQVAGAGVDMLAALGPAGLALGAGIGALALGATAAAEATITMARVMKTAARDVAQVSGLVASAEALNEVKHIQAMMRRARVAGPELARFTSAQGDLAAAIEDLKTTIVKMFGGPMGDLVKYAADITTGLAVILDQMGEQSWLKPLIEGILGAMFGILPTLDELRRLALEKKMKEFEAIKLDFLDFINPAKTKLGPTAPPPKLPKGIF